MKRLLILAAFAAASCLSACGGDAGPLTPAKAGKYLCIGVDAHAKTCQMSSVYDWDLFGHITNRMDIGVLGGHGAIEVQTEITSPVTIEPGGQVCSVLTADVIKGMTFKQNDAEVASDVEDRARAKALDVMAPMIGKKNCLIFTPAGDFVQLTGTLDGQPTPSGSTYAVWAGKKDGYVTMPFEE